MSSTGDPSLILNRIGYLTFEENILEITLTLNDYALLKIDDDLKKKIQVGTEKNKKLEEMNVKILEGI